MNWLLLGSKEYPFGAGALDDPLPSGGYEKYAEQLAKALADGGQGVHIVTRRFKNPAVSTDGKMYGKEKTKSGKGSIRVHTVPWVSGRLFRNPSFNAAATLKAASLDFDVVLAQGVMATLSALALKKIRNRPVIAMPAGVAFSQPQHGPAVSGTLRAMEKWAYRNADAVVFLSEDEKKQFEAKLGFLPAKSAVIAPGVAMPGKGRDGGGVKKAQGKKREQKGAAEKNAEAGTGLRLLFVGRLVGVKGLDVLLHAMVHARAELTVVGSGPEEGRLKALAERLGLKNVRFVGYHADPSAFYRDADVFVLPSFSEGLPLSALEAASHGLALVVTDIGLPFRDGKTALVVPAKNPTALAKAIRRLESDIKLKQKLARAAQAFVKANYSWKKTVRQLDELAVAVLKKPKPKTWKVCSDGP